MRKLCRIDISRGQELFERIERYKELLIKAFNPSAVILFGSVAKGDINEGSDVDLVVIADFQEDFLDRIKRLLDLNDDPALPLEPVGYTLEEFQRMRREGNRFIQEVLENGTILYGGVMPVGI